MYARSTDALPDGLTFDFAAGLIRDNLLVYDRETGSLWSQLAGRAVHGPLEGEPLEIVPSIQTTWAHWRRLHPDTRVMVMPGEEGRPYLYRNRRPGTPRPERRPTAHDTSALGLGLVVGDVAVFIPLRELGQLDEKDLPVELKVAGEPVRVHYEPSAPSAWATDTEGHLLPAVLVYEHGWLSFFPESRRLAVREAGS